MKNLKMTSFSKYINTNIYEWSDPNDAVEVYNLMKGLKKDGADAINGATGEATKFFYPDDPSLNTGVNDDIWADADDHISGDRRFLMNTGPFTMAPGDSQEVVFGIMMAAAGSAFNSFHYLKEVDALAQLAYDIDFALPESPPKPEVTASSAQEEIILTWDNSAESYSAVDVIDKLPVPVSFDTTWVTDIEDVFTSTSDTVIVGTDTTITVTVDTTYNYIQIVDAIDTTYQGENTEFVFEGYNVYQLETLSGTGNSKRVATYDLVNGVTEIFDDVFDANFGETVNRRVQFGSDSGVKRYIQITTDALDNNSPLKTNRVYYFAVVAYGYNPYGIPRTLESPLQIMALRPSVPTVWAETDTTAGFGDLLTATHSEGVSDGSVSITIIDAAALTTDDYKVSFSDELIADGDTSSVINWLLTNTTTGDVLVAGNATQGGVDFVSGVAIGDGANPITEGFQVAVAGPPNEFKDFYTTENANGAIDGWAGAAADYYGYPGFGRDNIDNQQTNGSTWFITTSSSSNYPYENFFSYVTRYAGGYGNSGGGMQYLVPDDFEFRFTGNGKMWDDDNAVFIDVPMEVWNIGSITDPADDFQMLPLFFGTDGNGDGLWNLAVTDHPISGGDNDPWLDYFYVVEHADRAPGTAGYQAMIDALTADPTSNGASGGYIWATGPGLPLAAPGQITRVVLLNMTFANWNGGDVTDSTFPANVDAAMPETGTVFRMTTTKPNALSDAFTFNVGSVAGEVITYSPKAINAWPNPYFGYNPEERNPVDNQVQFTHLPESGSCTIRIFDLSGVNVRNIEHNDAGSQFAVWDLKNNFELPVGSGMYLAHIETDEGDKVLKLAVVMTEQRIDVY
ncbi:MAG: T9SS type A sorting domain-containing protein [Bacteroidetes bacterium]|nr:T9SS type A sorting domain-containing protein [Bacteroidota bacterium]